MDLNSLPVEELKILLQKGKDILAAKEASTAKARVTEFLQTNAGKKLLADYADAMEVVSRYKNGKTIKMKMLLALELQAEVRVSEYNLNNDEFDTYELFQVSVSGNVKKTKGLSQEQVATLDYGLQETLGHACEDKMDLFPLLREELEGVTVELEEIADQLSKHNLEVSDLKEFLPKKKKK